MSGRQRSVCLVLHAHLPFVKPEGEQETLESRWFAEAVADVYLPMLVMLERLTRQRVPFKLALSVTPPLLAMLEDAEMNHLTELHLARLAELSRSELKRLQGEPNLRRTAKLYAGRYSRLLRYFHEIGGGSGWLGRIRSLAEQGSLELLAGAATHAFLPLVMTNEARRAQLAAGRKEHTRVFGKAPAGVWLPECGYVPELEPLLKELDYTYTVAELGRPRAGAVRTPGGVVLLERDALLSDRIWNAESGYPGYEAYRDYYRDIGLETSSDSGVPEAYLRPYLLPDGTRAATGMKYYRVTDRRGGPKQPYRRRTALAAARYHAKRFWNEAASPECSRSCRFEDKGAPEIVVCAFDAELFGHWWFEGTDFLESLFRRAERDAERLQLRFATPSEALAAASPAALPELAAGPSSWGRGGYADVWLQPKTDWMYPLLHQAEERMTRAADAEARRPAGAGNEAERRVRQRLLKDAARELMLAQCSDWAFWVDAGTMPAAAEQRFREHLDRFHRLLDASEQDYADNNGAMRAEGDFGADCASAGTLLPSLQWDWYCSDVTGKCSKRCSSVERLNLHKRRPGALRILMLTWEYPPHVVGGLGKAVGDLSQELASQGHEVHVITRAMEAPAGSQAADVSAHGVWEQGVIVHRVPVLQSLRPVPFLQWTLQMNVALADRAARLMARGSSFDVLHAHDWLVCAAAVRLSADCGIPLVATMHATEHGRRAGHLAGPVSPRLHELEARLVAAADETIVCSEAMRAELVQLFPPVNPRVIPCGHRLPEEHTDTDPAPASLHSTEVPIIAFLGRLVPEKGVQVLLRAMPLLLREFPALTLIIAGEGPLRSELEAQAAPFREHVRFAGFLAGEAKSALLERADVCVMPSLYEPFGLVALEAMAAGTPIIVSAVGGLAEIVSHGIDGLSFSPGDAAALASETVRLLRSPALALRLAIAAKRTVRVRFAPERIAADTVHVYEEAIRKRRTHSHSHGDV